MKTPHWYVVLYGLYDTGVQVKLELDDACWFYKEEERALTCTVNNFKDAISWKKDDWLIGFDGAPFGRNTHLYNITTNTTDTVRQEKLRIDSVIALNLTREQTGFLCQNHDHDSQTIKLSIPGDYQVILICLFYINY